MTTILAFSKGQAVSLRPDGHLAEEWNTYREAIRGSVYDPKCKVNLVPRHAWPKVALSLSQAGFTIETDLKADEWVALEAARASRIQLETKSRLDRFEAQLASRMLALRPYQ